MLFKEFENEKEKRRKSFQSRLKIGKKGANKAKGTHFESVTFDWRNMKNLNTYLKSAKLED